MLVLVPLDEQSDHGGLIAHATVCKVFCTLRVRLTNKAALSINTQILNILKIEGKGLLLKCSIYGYFELQIYDDMILIKHQKVKYINIFE